MGSNSYIKVFLKGVHDDYIPSISKSGRAQAAAVRSVKTNGSVRTNDSFPLGKQLRRLGQGTGRCQGPAGAGRRRQGPAALHLQRPEARAPNSHWIGGAARTVFREPRGQWRGRSYRARGDRSSLRQLRRLGEGIPPQDRKSTRLNSSN